MNRIRPAQLRQQPTGLATDILDAGEQAVTDHTIHLYPCYICKQRKPADEFHRNKSRSTRVSAGCKLCANTIRKGVPRRPKNIVVPDSKMCPDCDQIKAAGEFYGCITRSDGLGYHCKMCQSLKAKDRLSDPDHRRRKYARHKAWQQRPESIERQKAKYREALADPVRKRKIRAKSRAYYAKRQAESRQCLKRHKLSSGDYDLMVASQRGLCAICRRPPTKKPLAVDHDHLTGRIRGLLCGTCNTALGMFRDSPKILREAQRYIVQHSKEAPRQRIPASRQSALW